MEEKKEKQEKSINEKVKSKTEELILGIVDEGIQTENIKYLSELIDIHKDIENEIYWKEKINMYRGYDDYGTYGRRMRDSRGRYMDDGSYGRQGKKGTGPYSRYRGHDMLDNVYATYSDYMDDQEYGNYGTSESMMKIEVMTDSLMDFIHHLKKEAKSPEEKHLIDEKLKEIGRM